MSRLLRAFPFLLFGPLAFGQLVTGDVSIIGYQTKFNKPQQVAFVVWKDITAGSSIYLTDSGFFSDGTLRVNEGAVQWTAPSNIAAGSVIVWTEGDTGAFAGALDLTEGADQVFIGSVAFPTTPTDTTIPGTTYPGTLLTGLQISPTGWDPEAISDTTSALPSALSADENNFVGTQIAGVLDSSVSRTGTVESLRAAIDDPANWSFSPGANLFDLRTGGFDAAFTIIPESSTVLPLGALMGAVLLGSRRRFRRKSQVF